MTTLAQQKINKDDQEFKEVVSCYFCKHFDLNFHKKCTIGDFKVKNYSNSTCKKAESRF